MAAYVMLLCNWAEGAACADALCPCEQPCVDISSDICTYVHVIYINCTQMNVQSVYERVVGATKCRGERITCIIVF